MVPERTCLIPGCTRRTRSGSLTCRPHRRTSAARDWNATVRRATEDVDHAVEDGVDSEAAHEFRRRVAHGEYETLFDTALARIISQAAAQKGLDDEIGAVRYALARLLSEEQDPRQLALGVARLTRASVAASRERRESRQEEPNPLTEAMTRILAELDAEEQVATPEEEPSNLVPLHYPTAEERGLG